MRRRQDRVSAPLAEALGAKINAAREAAGLTLEDLAAKVEPPITRGQLWKIEQGAPCTPADRYQTIAVALGTTADKLMRAALRSLPSDHEFIPVRRRPARRSARAV